IARFAPPHIPYAPAFAAVGIDPARIIVIQTAQDNDQWWAAEQVLRANSAGALLFWPGNDHRLDSRLRRLQLAAQDGDALAFALTGTAHISQPSPSPLRLRLSSVSTGLRIDVFKRRGGVVSRPLFLAMTAMLPSPPSKRQHDATAFELQKKPIKPHENIDSHPAHRRMIHFNRVYPAGAPPAQIWNRALARAE